MARSRGPVEVLSLCNVLVCSLCTLETCGAWDGGWTEQTGYMSTGKAHMGQVRVAEWLRWFPAKELCSARESSNLFADAIFCFFF